MGIYAIADPHLSLSGEKPMDVFGAEWENHAERLKENWERTVGEGDVVIVAGDISWALKQDDAMIDLKWLAALPGQKVLVKGNHDLWWSSVSKLNALDPSMFFLQNSFYDAGGVAICGTRGWTCPGDSDFAEHDEKIYRRELLRLEASLKAAEKAGLEEKIVAIHFPPANDRKEVSGFSALIREHGVAKVVYGHLHGQEAFGKGVQGDFYGARHYLASLDFLQCQPLRIG